MTDRGSSDTPRAGLTPDPRDPEGPHDILAAEEFPLGEADPHLHREPPHDVLAAEEFPLPYPDKRPVPPGWAGIGRAGRARRPPRAATVAALLGCAWILAQLARRSTLRRSGGISEQRSEPAAAAGR
jgi:hypothetical protein